MSVSRAVRLPHQTENGLLKQKWSLANILPLLACTAAFAFVIVMLFAA